MRAQLRTYHAIPSLQAHQDAHAYKQLQDAPRLKSILKGGAEDRTEPSTLDQIKGIDVPRTNPVNMIFVICHAAQKVAELHFPNGQEFHDLIMKTQCSSQSRAMAFLWIIWFYLESDFTEEGCDENPFGSGVDYGVGVANQGVPKLVEMTEEELALENVDTETEKEFGREKQQTRAKILEMDQAYMTERDAKRKARQTLVDEGGPSYLPRIRPKHDSDMDSTRSTPPPKGGRGGARRGGNLKYQIFEGSSPARGEGPISRKPRPPTAHQLAVERNRNQRVEYILDRGMRKQHARARRSRKREGAIVRAYKRLQAMSETFEDSDDDEILQHAVEGEDKLVAVYREPGMGGLRVLRAEADNYGEEAQAYAAAIRRSARRLGRWTDKDDLGVIAPVKKHRAPKVMIQDDVDGDGEGYGVDEDDDDDDLDANGDVTMNDIDPDGDQPILDDDLDQTALMADDDDEDDDDDQDPDRTEAMGDSDGE